MDQETGKINIIIPFRSKVMGNREFIKNCKKIKKIKKKYGYGFFSSKNWLEKDEKERKYKLSFRSYPMRNRKFKTNSEKIQKIRRIPFWLHLKQK